MNKPDKAGEPSMDEILSSIRKIIAEEPIGSRPAPAPDTAPAAETPASSPLASSPSLSAVAPSNGSEQLRAEPSLNLGTPEVAPDAANGGLASAPSFGEPVQEVTSNEPTLPMPEEQAQSPAGRSPLSSRLANALRGEPPGKTGEVGAAMPSTLDDDDLAAALDPAPQSEPQSDMASATASAPPSPEAVPAATSFSPFAQKPEPEVIAATEPAAQASSPEQLAPFEETQQPPTPTMEPLNSEDARVPLFGAGPQPPQHLRPRAFSENASGGSDVASQADAQSQTDAQSVVAENAAEDVQQQDAFTEVPPLETASDGPVVIAAMAEPEAAPEPISVASDTETVTEPEALFADAAGVEDANQAEQMAQDDEPSSALEPEAENKPLVGLAAAVAEMQSNAAEESAESVVETTEALSSVAPSSEAEVVVQVPSSEAQENELEVAASDAASSEIEPAEAEAQHDSADEGDAATEEMASDVPAAQAASAEVSTPTVTASLSPDGVQTLENTVAELLRPLLRQWLAENMPRIVEKALRIEMAETVAQKTLGNAISGPDENDPSKES